MKQIKIKEFTNGDIIVQTPSIGLSYDAFEIVKEYTAEVMDTQYEAMKKIETKGEVEEKILTMVQWMKETGVDSANVNTYNSDDII